MDLGKEATKTIRIAITCVLTFCGLVMPRVAQSQAKVTYGQDIFLLKSLKPSLKNIGIMESKLFSKDIESIARAAAGQGIKITVAKVIDVREISGLYKSLVLDHHVEMLWIPDAHDNLLLGIGFEFIQENAILDRIGLCVPVKDLVDRGALCSIEEESGKLIVYVNQRIALIDGLQSPTSQNPAIEFVAR